MPVPVSATLIATMSSSATDVETTRSRCWRGFHGLDRIADQVEQNLLNLHLVGKHEIDRGIELKPHSYALVLGADKRKRACLLDQLR